MRLGVIWGYSHTLLVSLFCHGEFPELLVCATKVEVSRSIGRFHIYRFDIAQDTLRHRPAGLQGTPEVVMGQGGVGASIGLLLKKVWGRGGDQNKMDVIGV